jgi:plastocyanin
VAEQRLVWMVGVALAVSMACTVVETAEPAVHVVTIENMRFTPADLTVKRGERVVWINKDMVPHTATARSAAFDSGNIASTASWSYVADTVGTHSYVCTYHPTMSAKLTVQ